MSLDMQDVLSHNAWLREESRMSKDILQNTTAKLLAHLQALQSLLESGTTVVLSREYRVTTKMEELITEILLLATLTAEAEK